jgi:hypothetical protein
MSNNKFVKLCGQAYLFQAATLSHTHTHTKAAKLLISSANKTAVLQMQGTQITQPMCCMNQMKRDHMDWAQTIYLGTMGVAKDIIKIKLKQLGHV